jgi:O-antigen ligase
MTVLSELDITLSVKHSWESMNAAILEWRGWIDRAALLAFSLTIVLIPFRLNLTLLKRPMLPLYWDYTDFQLYASDAAMLVTLALWGLSLLVQRRSIRLGSPYIWPALAGLTLSGLLSVVGSIDRSLSLYQAIRLGLLFLFYLFVCNEITSPAWVIMPVGLQLALQVPVAIAQFLEQHSLGLNALGELYLDPNQNGVSIAWSESSRLLRSYGLADHPNILGGCVAFGLILLLAVYLNGNDKTRLRCAAIFLPGIVALFLTFSRSAWVAFLLACSLMLAVETLGRQYGKLIDAGWLALASGFVLLPFLLANLSFLGVRLGANHSFSDVPAEEQSLGERALLNDSANAIFSDHALTGVGLGASPLAIYQRFPDFSTNYQPPHFTLLAAALETGILGAACYFLLGALPWLGVFARRRELVIHPQLVAVSALLLAVTSVGFLDHYTWSSIPGRLWQWLAWALWAKAFNNR